MLAVSAGLSAAFSTGFSAADFSKAAFSERAFSEAAFSEAAFSEATFSDAVFSDAVFSEMAFSEMPLALTPARGRLATSEASAGFKSPLALSFFGLADEDAPAAGASVAGLATMLWL